MSIPKFLKNNQFKGNNMEPKFIELTTKDNEKILLNTLHIAWIEPNKSGSTIISNFVHYSLSKKVMESYDQIKALILS